MDRNERTLHGLLARSAARRPDHPAVVDAERGAAVTYGDFYPLVRDVRGRLMAAGVRPGDRVGLYAHKSIPVVAALFGVLEAGAAYVPVDPDAPAARAALIFDDCAVRVAVVERALLDGLRATADGAPPEVVTTLDALAPYGVDLAVVRTPAPEPTADPVADAFEATSGDGFDGSFGSPLAYILYTSGSTGRPKGVVHTHASALSFVDWCTDTLRPTEEDRFSSHAPLHFDLSILDLYVPLAHGATLVLFGEELGKQPLRLAPAIAEHAITVWYSTPSVLRLLAGYGRMEGHDYRALRIVCFAGEVFPLKHFRALKVLWPHPRYLNLYGPTETNVCTYYDVPADVPVERVDPFPIGRTCANDRSRVVDEHDRNVAPGEEGELYVTGGTVMSGYWNLPERTAGAFFVEPDGTRWYRTGDIVREDAGGDLLFVGRRDRMVKRRGYRVELGEIEAALYRHPSVCEAAVTAVPDEEHGVLILAFLTWEGDTRPSTIALKQFAAQNLPLYMVPDRFRCLAALPKTSTGKIDYQRLQEPDGWTSR